MKNPPLTPASVRRAARTVRDGQFVEGVDGMADCPAGSQLMSEPECHKAATHFGAKQYIQTVAEAVMPSGCYKFRQNVYFNPTSNGPGMVSRIPICLKVSAEAPTPRPPDEAEVVEKYTSIRHFGNDDVRDWHRVGATTQIMLAAGVACSAMAVAATWWRRRRRLASMHGFARAPFEEPLSLDA